MKKLFATAVAVNIIAAMFIVGLGVADAMPKQEKSIEHQNVAYSTTEPTRITIKPNNEKTRMNWCKIKDNLQANAVREVNRLSDQKKELGCDEIGFDNFRASRIERQLPTFIKRK